VDGEFIKRNSLAVGEVVGIIGWWMANLEEETFGCWRSCWKKGW
jgi:hypothetical protein